MSDRLIGHTHQCTTGVNGATKAGDQFGKELAAGDFNDDGMDDLAESIPLEDIGHVSDAGAVQLFFGQQDGRLNGIINDVLFSQENLYQPGFVATATQFGRALAAGTNGNLVNSNAINGSDTVVVVNYYGLWQ